MHTLKANQLICILKQVYMYSIYLMLDAWIQKTMVDIYSPGAITPRYAKCPESQPTTGSRPDNMLQWYKRISTM